MWFWEDRRSLLLINGDDSWDAKELMLGEWRVCLPMLDVKTLFCVLDVVRICFRRSRMLTFPGPPWSGEACEAGPGECEGFIPVSSSLPRPQGNNIGCGCEWVSS